MATDTHRSRPSETRIPPIAQLSQRQLRGADCVLCGVTLTAETAVDLGTRDRPEASGHWFPRACTSHPGVIAAPPARVIPNAADLVYAQSQGWACVWCGVSLDGQTGAHHIGYARGQQGAHNLDCEAWSCTRCKDEWPS